MEVAPDKEEYFARIQLAANVHDLELLVQLWRQAPYVLSKFNSLVSRAAIKRSLKELGTYYHIPVTQKTTFPEFMALYDKKKIAELIKGGDAAEIIAYLRDGGSERAHKVNEIIRYKPKFFDDLRIRGSVLYWILLKIKNKKDRREAADFYPLLRSHRSKGEYGVSERLAQGILEEAQRENNYEPLNFFVFSTGNIRLMRWLLETDELAFWKGLVDGLVRYPEEAKNRLKFFGPEKLDIFPLLPMLKDNLPTRVYLEIAEKILLKTAFDTPVLINLFDSTESQVFRNTIIFKLIEESSSPEEENVVRDLIKEFGYDEDFDPYTEILAENKAKLRNILGTQPAKETLPIPKRNIPLRIEDVSSEEEEEDLNLDSNSDYSEEESESLLSEESD